MTDRTTRTDAHPPERRVYFLYRLDQPARFHLCHADLQPPGVAGLHDLSVGGLFLRLHGHLLPGCRLRVVFCADGVPTQEMEVEVTHSTAQGDGTWLVGCRSARILSEEEVKKLAAFKEPPTPDASLPAVLVVDDEPLVRRMLS